MSLPAPPTRASAAPPKDIDKIREKLAPAAINARKDELVREKEESLRDLVDEHDTAVREKFHLERYISLLEGYDPVVRGAKPLESSSLTSSTSNKSNHRYSLTWVTGASCGWC
jgi:hypothetical protein